MYTAESFQAAASLEEAYTLLCGDRNNAILGGGMWMRMGKASYHTLIDLSHLGLDSVTQENGFISIGAMVPLRLMETSPLLVSRYQNVLSTSVSSIIGTQFRNMATVGGSVAGRYGFSDVVLTLLALDAEIEFYHNGRIKLSDYLAGRPIRDILVRVLIPDDGRKAIYLSQRLTKTDFSILAVCLCGCTDGSFRLTVGSRPGGPIRCPTAENALAEDDVNSAKKAVSALVYGSNLRGSEEYRRAISAVLTERAYHQWKEIVK